MWTDWTHENLAILAYLISHMNNVNIKSIDTINFSTSNSQR